MRVLHLCLFGVLGVFATTGWVSAEEGQLSTLDRLRDRAEAPAESPAADRPSNSIRRPPRSCSP